MSEGQSRYITCMLGKGAKVSYDISHACSFVFVWLVGVGWGVRRGGGGRGNWPKLGPIAFMV